jgi:signal transduction histidine kinase
MRITDDGIGLRPDLVCSSKTFGLQGMRERLRMLDGSLEIASAPGGGTELRIAIPARLALAAE